MFAETWGRGLQVLRVFVGEGDQYSGWVDIDDSLVDWWLAPEAETFTLYDRALVIKYMYHQSPLNRTGP